MTQPTDVILCNADVLFTQEGDRFYLEFGTLRFNWDNGMQWFLTLEDKHSEANSVTQYKGLCGDYNNDPAGKFLRKAVPQN